jgi:hypothetical protein
MDFSKILTVEEIAKAAAQAFLESENVTLTLMPQKKRPPVQLSIDREVQFLSQGEGAGCLRQADQHQCVQVQFKAAGSACFFNQTAGYAHTGLFPDQVCLVEPVRFVHDTLQQAVTQAQDKESHFTHVAQGVDLAADGNGLVLIGCCNQSAVCRDFSFKFSVDLFHANLLMPFLNIKNPEFSLENSGTDLIRTRGTTLVDDNPSPLMNRIRFCT